MRAIAMIVGRCGGCSSGAVGAHALDAGAPVVLGGDARAVVVRTRIAMRLQSMRSRCGCGTRSKLVVQAMRSARQSMRMRRSTAVRFDAAALAHRGFATRADACGAGLDNAAPDGLPRGARNVHFLPHFVSNTTH